MAKPAVLINRKVGRLTELRDLIADAQMALELGGLNQVLVWGRARLALSIPAEEQEWLRPIVDKLQRDADAKQRRQQLKREQQHAHQLKHRRTLLNKLETTYQREQTRWAIEADRVISDSLGGRLSVKAQQQEKASKQRRQEAMARRIEQEQARRRGEQVPGRWLISR